MAATGNITVTAPLGPGNTVSSLVLSASRKLEIDYQAEVVRITDQKGKIHEFDYETIATITHSISGEVDTCAIST